MVSALYVIQLLSCAAVICLIFPAFVNNTVISAAAREHYPIKSALLWVYISSRFAETSLKKRNFIDEFIIRLYKPVAYFGYFSADRIFKEGNILPYHTDAVPAEFFIALRMNWGHPRIANRSKKLTGCPNDTMCKKATEILPRRRIAFQVYIKAVRFQMSDAAFWEICKSDAYIYRFSS